MMPDRTDNETQHLRVSVRARLAARLPALDQAFEPDAVERMVNYLGELARWNRAYNLTAVHDPAEMVDRHLIDSLSIRPFLTGRRILDAGTGAGLPGVVLAIAEPGRHFILVDSGGKKIRFLRHVQRSLGLENIEPVQARVESLELDPAPDEIVARALAPLARLVEWLSPFIDRGARLLAMKGRLEQAEVDEVPEGYRLEIQTVDSSAVQAERCVAIVTLRNRSN